MTDENLYRYDATLGPTREPEPKSSINLTQVIHICCKGWLAGAVAGVILGIVIEPETVGDCLFLTLYTLIPICVFGMALYQSHHAIKAQIGFWIAAVPLAIVIGSGLFNTGFLADVAHYIGRAALIGYVTELLPVSLTLHYFTNTALKLSQIPEE